jgi:HK97 family phage major capsid protein
MSDVKVNHSFENDAHVYRRGLNAFEARTGLSPELVDTHGSGEEKQMFARMDAALTAAELKAQNAALEARLAKLEAQPTLQTRAPRIEGGSEAESREWLTSVLRGDMASARALGTATIASGSGQLGLTAGSNVPTDMERRIREKLYQASVIRQLATINTIDSKRTLLVENALPTAALVGEGAAVTLSDPSWSTVAVTPYKYGAGTQVSQEFIEDAIGNAGIGSVMDYVSNRLALAIGRKMDEDFTTGAGTSGPQGIARTGGITTGINLGTQPQVITNVTADNIIDAVHAVKPQYRASPRFRWLFHDEFLKVARKLKTTYGTVGTPTNTYTPATEYVWTPGTNGNTLNGGAPATLYGVPYSISEWVNNGAGSAVENTVYAIVGDFTYFEIFDRTGMTATVDPYSAMGSAATTMYVWARTDSRVTLAEAFAAIRV